MMAQIHFMIFVPNTSRTFGILMAAHPNRMQARTFPSTQMAEGTKP